MMIAFARAANASVTRARRSVQISSFLKPRLCQDFVRSTIPPRAPSCNGSDHPLTAQFLEQGPGLVRVVTGIQMHGDLIGQVDPEPAELFQRGAQQG